MVTLTSHSFTASILEIIGNHKRLVKRLVHVVILVPHLGASLAAALEAILITLFLQFFQLDRVLCIVHQVALRQD